jgi:HEAT repeat protein
VKLGADLAAPVLVAELEHEDRLHRYAATWALSSLRVPAALPRLAARVFDPEMRIAATALEVLDGYRDEPGFAAAMDDLRSYLRRGDAFQRRRAILAACELRDRDALSAVVDLLGTRPREVAEEARRALVEITKQDFATSERKWRAWIDEHARVPRVRWLIDALAHKDEAIRKSAQSELNRITGQYFGFRWDAARGERDASIQVWNAWWAEQQDTAKWP